jgi:hypothetical protein
VVYFSHAEERNIFRYRQFLANTTALNTCVVKRIVIKKLKLSLTVLGIVALFARMRT